MSLDNLKYIITIIPNKYIIITKKINYYSTLLIKNLKYAKNNIDSDSSVYYLYVLRQ